MEDLLHSALRSGLQRLTANGLKNWTSPTNSWSSRVTGPAGWDGPTTPDLHVRRIE
jgi:hypothetical protein